MTALAGSVKWSYPIDEEDLQMHRQIASIVKDFVHTNAEAL